MAYANWLKPDKTSGSGTGTVNMSATEHTGRDVRTTTVHFKASNTEEVVRTVSQAGKPEFVDIADTATASKNGGAVLIKGYSNSYGLKFEEGYNPDSTGMDILDIPLYYTANSISAPTDGGAIEGDPGKVALYEFSISVGVPSNTTVEDKTYQLVVTADNGVTDSCTITVAAGDAYIRVTPSSINITWEGAAVPVQVESNTDWSIY